MGEQSFLAKTPAYHHDVHAPPIRISLSFPPLQPLRPHGYSLLDNANIKTFSGPCKCEYPFYPPRMRNRPILRLFDQYFISPLFIHPPDSGSLTHGSDRIDTHLSGTPTIAMRQLPVAFERFLLWIFSFSDLSHYICIGYPLSATSGPQPSLHPLSAPHAATFTTHSTLLTSRHHI